MINESEWRELKEAEKFGMYCKLSEKMDKLEKQLNNLDSELSYHIRLNGHGI